MKKIIIGISVFCIILIVFLGLRFLSFGSKSQTMGASLVNLDIPKFSSIKDECCNFKATFKSLRSAKVLEKELDKIMDSYMKVSCNGETYYYNIKSDVTIISYYVNSSKLINTYEIVYEKGNICLK